MSEIKIDGNTYGLKQFSEMLEKQKVEFSFWSGRKIILFDNLTKFSFHYNKILDSLLQIDFSSFTDEDRLALNLLTGRLRRLKDKGHRIDSFRQKIYNLFRRLIPNFFRESKIEQLEKLTLAHTRSLFNNYVDYLLNLKETEQSIYLNLILLMDSCNTEEERVDLLTIFLQCLDEKIFSLPQGYSKFVKILISEINEDFGTAFARSKENGNFEFFNKLNYNPSPLIDLNEKNFKDAELKRVERYFSDGSPKNINILNSIQQMLPKKKERLSFLKDAKNLMNGISNKPVRMAILKKILEFLPKDQKDRCFLIRALKTFTNDISKINEKTEKAAILSKLSEILTKNKENCFSIMQDARTFISEISNDRVEFDVRIAILELMQTFPKEQSLEEKLSLIQHAKILMDGITSGQDRAIILQAVAKLPTELRVSDRLSLIQHAKILMDGITSGQDRAIILQAVAKLPIELKVGDRLSLIENAKTLMFGITSGYEKTAILQAVAKSVRTTDTINLLITLVQQKIKNTGRYLNGGERIQVLNSTLVNITQKEKK